MNQKTTIYFLFAVAVICFVMGCSAPHENPLDPKSEFYREPADTSGDRPILIPRIRSEHISQIFPSTDSYTVVAELRAIGQPAVDSVWVRYLDGRWFTMNPIGGVWVARIASNTLGDYTLGSVIGQPFTYSAFVHDGTTYGCGPAYLFRVIETVPQVISPASYDTLTSLPLLVWQAYSANFPFHYNVSISNYNSIVWNSGYLDPSQLSIQVSDTLPDSLYYYWTVSIVDSFQDSTRSKEGPFFMGVLTQ